VKYLIAGLGNIGAEYANTRHNIGFIVADALALEGKAVFTPGRLADVTKVKYKGRILVVIKPSTYMNLSGKAVKYWLNKETIPLENLLVAYDDVDLPLGTLRLRPGGGSAGQKGMQSIIERLGTEEFPRLRIGTGRPPGRQVAADYVLEDFPSEDAVMLEETLDRAVQAVLTFLEHGLERAMNLYNG